MHVGKVLVLQATLVRLHDQGEFRDDESEPEQCDPGPQPREEGSIVLEFGYRSATGREPPTARNRNVPFRQVLVWATVTGAALTAVTVIVDQFVRH